MSATKTRKAYTSRKAATLHVNATVVAAIGVAFMLFLAAAIFGTGGKIMEMHWWGVRIVAFCLTAALATATAARIVERRYRLNLLIEIGRLTASTTPAPLPAGLASARPAPAPPVAWTEPVQDQPAPVKSVPVVRVPAHAPPAVIPFDEPQLTVDAAAELEPVVAYEPVVTGK